METSDIILEILNICMKNEVSFHFSQLSDSKYIKLNLDKKEVIMSVGEGVEDDKEFEELARTKLKELKEFFK